jgi:hypothetical protein
MRMLDIQFLLQRRTMVAALAMLAGGACGPALALERPQGQVVLTLSGPAVTGNQTDGKAHFDMKMLAQLPQQSFSTQTPWYPQPISFTGPLLRDVLAAAGVKQSTKPGSKIVLTALNGYKAEMPFEDAVRFDVIIARLMNERPMPVREKGPLFVVYPFDSRPELKADQYYGRSIWQLRSVDLQ